MAKSACEPGSRSGTRICGARAVDRNAVDARAFINAVDVRTFVNADARDVIFPAIELCCAHAEKRHQKRGDSSDGDSSDGDSSDGDSGKRSADDTMNANRL
jgi:hypothetical protein